MNPTGQGNQGRGKNNQNEPVNWWAIVGGVAAGAAVIGGVAAAIHYGSKKKERNPNESASTSGALNWVPPSTNYERSSNFLTAKALIAVDARPNIAAGLIRLTSTAGKQKVKYYSVDWTGYFAFPNESEKFEMANAILALLVFKDNFHDNASNVALKCDNIFGLTLRGYRDADDNNMLEAYKTLMKDLNVQFQHATVDNDGDIRIVDKLSRQSSSSFETLSAEPDTDMEDISYAVIGYLSKLETYVADKYKVNY